MAAAWKTFNNTQKLLDNATSDGAGETKPWSGGYGGLHVYGTWDGATVTLNVSALGASGSFLALDNGVFTADAFKTLLLGPCRIYAEVSSAGAGTNLNVHLTG